MNSEAIFNDLVGVMAVITMIPVFFLWLERKTRWKVFDYLPAIIWIFLTPILLSNLGIIPKASPIYSIFKSFAVPLFIVLMLLDINIRESLRVAWRGAGSGGAAGQRRKIDRHLPTVVGGTLPVDVAVRRPVGYGVDWRPWTWMAATITANPGSAWFATCWPA